MTIFETAFRNYLIQSNLFGQRVFLWMAPQVPASQAKVPYIVFFPVAPTTHPLHGRQLDLQDRDYQISIFDPSQTKVLALADSLRQYLNGVTEPNYEGVHMGMVLFTNQHGAYSQEAKLFQVIQEYRIQFHLSAEATA